MPNCVTVNLSDFFLSRITLCPTEALLSLAFASTDTTRLFEDLWALELAVNDARPLISEKLFHQIPQVGDCKVRSKLLNLRRKVHTTWEPLDQNRFVFLASANPTIASMLDSFNSLLEERSSLLKRWDQYYREELSLARARLKKILRDAFVREGIFLSSDNLAEAVLRYMSLPETTASEDVCDLEASVVEHISRTCAKSTPRSLLAGVSWGRLSCAQAEPAKVMRFGENPIAKRKTLLNWPVVRRLARSISWQGKVWRFVVPRANPTWHVIQEKLYFWSKKDEEAEVLRRLPAYPMLLEFLRNIEPRTRTAQEVLIQMSQDCREDMSVFEQHYRTLCRQGLIIGHVEIPFIELDGIDFLVRWVKDLPVGVLDDLAVRKLEKLHDNLKRLDDPGWMFNSRKESLYSEIQMLVADLISSAHDSTVPETPYHPEPVAKLVVVDSVAPCEEITLGKPIIEAIKEATEKICLLSNFARKDISKKRMIKRLGQRFPNQSSIPILALYASKGREDFMENEEEYAESRSICYLCQLLKKFTTTASREHILHIEPTEWDQFIKSHPPAEDEGIGCFLFHIVAASYEELNRGKFKVVCDSVFPTPLLLSRWAHLFSSAQSKGPVETSMDEYLEPNLPNDIQADILYNQDHHRDTAGWHPSYFPYAIEVSEARSHFHAEKIIPLRELFLKLNHEKDTIELTWTNTKFSKRVLPRNASLLDPSINPWVDVFTRLEFVAGTKRSSLGSWLRCNTHTKRHQPRIEVGRIILCREAWKFSLNEIPDTAKLSGAGMMLECNQWRKKHKMPRFVFIHTRTASPWLLDFYNPFHIRVFSAQLRKPEEKQWFVIEEALPAPDGLWTQNSRGRVAHEIAVPFRWKKEISV